MRLRSGINLAHFDLPLEATVAGRLLPWTIGALVCAAVIMLAVAAIADGVLRLPALRGKLVTVTLPPAPARTQRERELDRVLAILQRTTGVASAAPVPAEELETLLAPWLGEIGKADEALLPQLIDVVLDHESELQPALLQDELRAAVPGTTIAIEAATPGRTGHTAAFLRASGGIAAILLVAGSVTVVAAITRLSLKAQAQNVELLRSLGAPDSYIARQFATYALLSGLKGGSIGFALGAAGVAILLDTGLRIEVAGASEVDLRPVHWLVLACVPVASAVLAAAAARISALHTLGRMA